MKGLRNILYRNLVLAVLTVAALTPAVAQNSKKDREKERVAVVENLINSKNFVFVAENMNPLGGRIIFLNSLYDLRVTEEKIDSRLPYFGRAYVAPIDPTRGALDFTSEDFDYNVRETKRGGWDVLIVPRDNREIRQITINVSPAGYASMQVLSNNRQAISFNGRIEELKIKKS